MMPVRPVSAVLTGTVESHAGEQALAISLALCRLAGA